MVASSNLVRPIKLKRNMAKKKFKVDKHILIPKHTKLGEKEKAQLLQKYNASLKDFPRILKTDAVIQGLGAVTGDIIKIIRKSQTAGEVIFYRVVSDV